MELLKNILKKKFITMAIFGFIFFSIFYFLFNIFTQNVPYISSLEYPITPTDLVSNSSYKLPIRIEIPQIGVNSIVEHVGLMPDGTIGVPANPDNAAWFSGGPIPGLTGNAIVDGHSGWKDNKSAVFDNLKDLKEGDKIYIEDSEGTIITFVVRELKIYHKNDKALDVFNSNDNKSHLNLITCIGVWNVSENGRDSRLVVFSDLLEK